MRPDLDTLKHQGFSDTIPSLQYPLFTRDVLLGSRNSGAASFLLPCSPRSVFPNEAVFEATLLHEPGVMTFLSQTVGRTVESLANQVSMPSGRLRADVLGQTAHPAGGVVVELTLEPCDADHLQRGMLYTMALNRLALVLVAPSFPPAVLAQVGLVRSWLEQNRSPFDVHLWQLSTWRDADGGHYSLATVDPVRAVPLRTRLRLEAIAAQAAQLGDRSLANLSITENRMFESYSGFAAGMRLRVYAGLESTRISVFVQDGELLARLHTELRLDELKEGLAGIPATLNGPSDDSVLFSVTLPASETAGERPDAGEILDAANAYVQTRRAVVEALERIDGMVTPRARVRFHPNPAVGVRISTSNSSRLAS